MKLLSTIDSKSILTMLNHIWGIKDDHWVPLADKTINKQVVFFPQKSFLNDYSINQLRQLVGSISKNQIYKWHWETKHRELFEISLEELIPFDEECLEKYYFDRDFEWVIYMSHENTIAFGGDEINNLIKSKWSGWGRNLNQWD